MPKRLGWQASPGRACGRGTGGEYRTTSAPSWERAQVLRLAKRLGYELIWPDERSVLSVADQARNAGRMW